MVVGVVSVVRVVTGGNVMISISFVVNGDKTGFDWKEVAAQKARYEEEHKLSSFNAMSASRMCGREGLWRVTLRYSG